MKRVTQLFIIVELLTALSCFADVINIEILSPFTKTGTYTYSAAGTNSTNIAVASGEKITVRQHHVRHGYTSIGGASITRVKVRYGVSTNVITIYDNYQSVQNGSYGNDGSSLIGKTIYGPCEITFEAIHQNNTLTTNNGNYEYNLLAFFSLESEKTIQSTDTNPSGNTVPSTAVVVPANATGDVDVLLEQSTDMITWTQCLPGTYNSSTVKRFFRLRAVEK